MKFFYYCEPPVNILVPLHIKSGLEIKYFDNTSIGHTQGKNY